MPPIGRLLAILASLLVGKAAEYGLTLDPAELTTLMLGVYAGLHTLYRKWRAGRDNTSSIGVNQLPKGTL